MKRELSITRLYELVEVDTLRGLVFRRGHSFKPRGWDNGHGYLNITLDGSPYRVSRLIWAFAHGQWPPSGCYIDHINGVRFDNRLSNLRLATPLQNRANCRFPGASWHPPSRRWRAQFNKRGRKKHLGLFLTREEAVEAYRKAHAELHGEFSPYYVKAAS
jgi:hypothetical protein